MTKFYFTFGSGQKHENGFHIIEAEDVMKAREIMFERYGAKWCTHYTEEDWVNEDGITQQEEYNLHEVKWYEKK